jgi:hypothetical protein
MKRLLLVRAWVLCFLFGGHPSHSAAQYVFTNVVDSTMAAPSGTFSRFFNPAISGNRVAFVGDFSDGTGVFVSSGGALTTIAKAGDTAPNGSFIRFDSPAIGSSTVAFRGFYPPQTFGIFAGNGGD